MQNQPLADNLRYLQQHLDMLRETVTYAQRNAQFVATSCDRPDKKGYVFEVTRNARQISAIAADIAALSGALDALVRLD